MFLSTINNYKKSSRAMKCPNCGELMDAEKLKNCKNRPQMNGIHMHHKHRPLNLDKEKMPLVVLCPINEQSFNGYTYCLLFLSSFKRQTCIDYFNEKVIESEIGESACNVLIMASTSWWHEDSRSKRSSLQPWKPHLYKTVIRQESTTATILKN